MQNLLRKDGNYIFYQIEEYQSAYDRWVTLQGYYLREYKFGQNTACGDCWQEIGIHGIYDWEYAKKYCNELNNAVREGKINTGCSKVTEFRIVKCEVSQKRTPLEFNAY